MANLFIIVFCAAIGRELIFAGWRKLKKNRLGKTIPLVYRHGSYQQYGWIERVERYGAALAAFWAGSVVMMLIITFTRDWLQV